jgi:hypothetical protein
MGYIKPDHLKEVYTIEINRLEKNFFDGMKAGKTLEEIKPLLLQLKQVKIYLRNLNAVTINIMKAGDA